MSFLFGGLLAINAAVIIGAVIRFRATKPAIAEHETVTGGWLARSIAQHHRDLQWRELSSDRPDDAP